MGNKRTGFIDSRRVYGDKMILGKALTGTVQEIEQQSVPQNYALGTKLILDERVYHYARAGAALVAPCTYRLQTNQDLNAPSTWGLALGLLITAGDRTVTVVSGAYQGGTVAADELVGGWIEVWPAAGFMWRRIISNTAAVAGGNFVITVDRPFDLAVAVAGSSVALHHSIYRDVRMGGTVPATVHYESAVGLTPIPVASGSFFWLQTYGPCFIAAQLGQPGAVVGFRDVYLGAAGTVLNHTQALALEGVSPQRVGYIMGASTNADGNDDVMLQLAP